MGGIGGFARTAPDKTAIIEGGRATTFGDLERRSAAIAGMLAKGGLRKGDRIAVYSGNRTEVLEVTIAALRAGIVAVPVNSLLTQPEVTYLLEDSGAKWLFTDRPVDAPPSVARTMSFGDAFERNLHGASPAPIDDFTLAKPMLYTSGTTGQPKGVWVAPQRPEVAARISEDFQRLWGITDEDVHIVCSPLAHSAPLRYSTRTLEAGGTVVVQKGFDPAETLAAIEMFSVTSTFMVPTHLERIIDLDPSTIRRHDLSTMRMLAHAGAPIRTETKERVMELFPEDSVWEFYSATEGAATRISPDEWRRKPGSVGRPHEGIEVIIRDEAGRVVGPEETGEIWVQDREAPPYEYWGDPEKTARARWNGAVTYGDLGYLDRDGYLYVVGRAHDTIISGGVNVYPREVEEVLLTHPSVQAVAVYGAEHPEWGQEVRAMVVRAPEQPLDPELLRKWARERLAGFKCPRQIIVVDDLPRTPTGKILRRDPDLRN